MIMVTVDELYGNPPSIEDAIAVRIANVISNRIREVHFIKEEKSAEILLSDFYLEDNVDVEKILLKIIELFSEAKFGISFDIQNPFSPITFSW